MKINFTYNIRIENEKFGTLMNETFVDHNTVQIVFKDDSRLFGVEKRFDFLQWS